MPKGSADKPAAEKRLEEIEAIFSALAHPARRQVLLFVHFRNEPVTAGDIAGRFHAAWPTTTRHLRVLEAAGLLTQRREGRFRYYRVNHDKLKLATEWLSWFNRQPGSTDDS